MKFVSFFSFFMFLFLSGMSLQASSRSVDESSGLSFMPSFIRNMSPTAVRQAAAEIAEENDRMVDSHISSQTMSGATQPTYSGFAHYSGVSTGAIVAGPGEQPSVRPSRAALQQGSPLIPTVSEGAHNGQEVQERVSPESSADFSRLINNDEITQIGSPSGSPARRMLSPYGQQALFSSPLFQNSVRIATYRDENTAPFTPRQQDHLYKNDQSKSRSSIAGSIVRQFVQTRLGNMDMTAVAARLGERLRGLGDMLGESDMLDNDARATKITISPQQHVTYDDAPALLPSQQKSFVHQLKKASSPLLQEEGQDLSKSNGEEDNEEEKAENSRKETHDSFQEKITKLKAHYARLDEQIENAAHERRNQSLLGAVLSPIGDTLRGGIVSPTLISHESLDNNPCSPEIVRTVSPVLSRSAATPTPLHSHHHSASGTSLSKKSIDSTHGSSQKGEKTPSGIANHEQSTHSEVVKEAGEDPLHRSKKQGEGMRSLLFSRWTAGGALVGLIGMALESLREKSLVRAWYNAHLRKYVNTLTALFADKKKMSRRKMSRVHR